MASECSAASTIEYSLSSFNMKRIMPQFKSRSVNRTFVSCSFDIAIAAFTAMVEVPEPAFEGRKANSRSVESNTTGRLSRASLSRAMQSAIDLGPVRQTRFGLGPAGHAPFVAPVHQPWHDLQVRTAGHERTHGALVFPQGQRPEGQLAIAEQRPLEKTGDLFALSPNPDGIKEKAGQKAQRAQTPPLRVSLLSDSADSPSGEADLCR